MLKKSFAVLLDLVGVESNAKMFIVEQKNFLMEQKKLFMEQKNVRL